jgi:endonuclease-8
LQGKPSDYFNFKIDISKPEFDVEFILNELQTKYAEAEIGAALLNQNILAGVGPIIRTETLYHAKIHPESLIKSIPEKKLIFLLQVIVDYAEEILALMKTDSVEKNALIFEKKNCPKDKTLLIIEEEGNIKTYLCPKCQKLFK